MKEATAIPFVGGPAATVQQALPIHKLFQVRPARTEKKKKKKKCVGFCSPGSAAGRSTSAAVSPSRPLGLCFSPAPPKTGAGGGEDYSREAEWIKTHRPIQGDTRSLRHFMLRAAPLGRKIPSCGVAAQSSWLPRTCEGPAQPPSPAATTASIAALGLKFKKHN